MAYSPLYLPQSSNLTSQNVAFEVSFCPNKLSLQSPFKQRYAVPPTLEARKPPVLSCKTASY